MTRSSYTQRCVGALRLYERHAVAALADGAAAGAVLMPLVLVAEHLNEEAQELSDDAEGWWARVHGGGAIKSSPVSSSQRLHGAGDVLGGGGAGGSERGRAAGSLGEMEGEMEGEMAGGEIEGEVEEEHRVICEIFDALWSATATLLSLQP